MAGDAEGVAREFFAGRFDRWPDDAFELLAEDVVINPSDGHIYVGHEGFSRWYEERVLGEHAGRISLSAGIEIVREHWVLMRSAAEGAGADEQTEPTLGCWLVHVREGLIAAILHYRTERAARGALSTADGEPPVGS